MMWIMMMDNDIKGMSDILTVCNLLYCVIIFFIITYREITISGVVPKLKSDKYNPLSYPVV